jgi:ABC-type uncharacterized transport system permease subunit
MVHAGFSTAFAALALCAYAALIWAAWRQHGTERGLLGLVCVLHGASILALAAAEPLRFGFATALSCTAWLALAVYALEALALKNLRVEPWFAAAGALTVGLAYAFPGAVVRSHPQLGALWPLHWVLAFAGYGMLASAAAHAWWWRRSDERARSGVDATGPAVMLIERLMFRFLWVGFGLLSLGILTGWVVADKLGGMRWDHKTVFAMLAWLSFAVLLMARWGLGWRGQRVVRLVFVGTGLLALSYVGSRFVLELVLQRGV